ncbi:MAG: helix-turn-helix transcriptional regulator [Candidatus Nanopelagicales bacterium]
MAAPHTSPVPRTVATKEALARLRRIVDNNELAERIPIELCRAGFARVLFSLIQNNNWVARSAHVTGDEAMSSALLKAGREHPRRLCQPLPESAMVRNKTPILVDRPQSDPRVNSDLVAVVKPDVYVAAPVYVWQTPVGLLHADAPSEAGDVGPGDRDILGVFAEGLGAIMERNIVLDRMRAMHQAAVDHLGAVDSYSSDFEAELARDAEPPETMSTPDDPIAGGVAERLTRRELQVLNLLAAGKTNAHIAGRLFLSEGTVKSHIRHIMAKLDAGNRTEAVARYRQLTTGSL